MTGKTKDKAPLLQDLPENGTLTYFKLDQLLDVPAEEFDGQAEALAKALNLKNINLKNTSERPPLPPLKTPNRGATFANQILSLPRLDREDEYRLARRYTLVKQRFSDALQRFGLANDQEALKDFYSRQNSTTNGNHCGCCAEWEQQVDWSKIKMIKARCQEYNETRNTFIEGSLYIVILALSRFHHSNVAWEDLLQEGSASLFRAVDRYDWTKGVRFRTYAEYWINQSFMETIYNQSRTVRVPAWVQKASRKIHQTKVQLGNDDAKMIGASLSLSPEKVMEILAENRQTISLDWEKTEGDSGSFVDALASDGDTMEEAIKREKDQLLPHRMEQVLDSIPPREKMVLEHRFGLGGKMIKTLTDLGNDLGISAERVRQIQESALRRLKEPARKKILMAI